MTGKRSRRKGHDFERELVRLFRAAMPGANVKRGLQYRDGAECADVTAGPFHIEAKAGKAPPLRPALEQAERGAPQWAVPIAVVKEDRNRPIVVMRLDDFESLVHEWWRQRSLEDVVADVTTQWVKGEGRVDET
jgi:hypothetical protein